MTDRQYTEHGKLTFLPNSEVICTNKHLRSLSLSHLCSKMFYIFDTNNVILDYRFFRLFGCTNSYDIIIQYVVSQLLSVVESFKTFRFHVNMDGLMVTHIEKHGDFIQKIATVLKSTFPDKLDMCYIYNAPFMFSTLFGFVSIFIDRPTLLKIKLVPCGDN